PNAGITDQNKIDIGVPPVNTNREPVNVPASSPLLNVLGATPGSQTVRYADTSTPDSGGRPFGAANLQLFVSIAAAPTTDATNATKAAAVLTITFNQPVSLAGIPAYTTNLAGITPVLASMTNPTTLSLTFSATVATATSLVVPFEEGAVRNPSGGFVNAGTFPV